MEGEEYNIHDVKVPTLLISFNACVEVYLSPTSFQGTLLRQRDNST
jgi:hypothetical protein